MNIFISGVAGFIGFSLADYFLKKILLSMGLITLMNIIH